MVAADAVRTAIPYRSTTSPDMTNPATPVSDAALVRRIRSGDERALELVFRAHYAGMAAFVHRYVNAPDVAEELVQDIFLKLWSRREQLSEIESLKTYLYREIGRASCRERV